MRLDLLVSEKLGISRTRAQNVIKTGGVTMNGTTLDKPSADVDPTAILMITDTLKYASLGGVKMENAMDSFRLNAEGLVCLDVGAANGGFTDCLLRRGAKSVASLDLNIAFPHELRNDERVKLFDKTNVKSVGELFPEATFDLIAVDLSFISLTTLFSLFYPLLKDGGLLLVLFKPQFEVGRKFLPKSGIVHDKKAIENAFSRVVDSAQLAGFRLIGQCPVPDIFPEKNKERTVLFVK